MNDLVPLLTAKETAKILSISERTLWSLTNSGEIPCIRLRTSVRYDPADLAKWIAKRKRKTTGSISAPAVGEDAEPQPVKKPRRRRKRG